jgi:methylated-DNA-[protein]-cysteine S-methyltransferase
VPVCRLPSSFGELELSWSGAYLTGCWIHSHPSPASATAPPPAWLQALGRHLQAHLEGEPGDFADAPFAWAQVTPFQAEVYRAALRVKAGQLCTYGQLAAAIGRPPGAARAVGGALGRNPWLILVPCHRFVAGNGALTGFSAPGGTALKASLLELEGAPGYASLLGAG